MNKQILFVHIPKTAGTSFRKAAESYLGQENVYYDYSPASVETSPKILEYVYEEKDMYKLKQLFQKHERLFLSGHFHVGKYMFLFDTVNVITFVRNPIDQVISHYHHHCRDLNYKENFVTFIKDKRFKNMQSRMLSAKPLELYGFIGLTEEYAKSIELINASYGIDLKVLATNVTKDKKIVRNKIDEDILELIKKENQQDILMYEHACKIFNDRLSYFENGKDYVCTWIQEQKENSIRGVAFKRNSDEPTMVTLMDGDKEVEVRAASIRPGLVAHGVPRAGFIGFEYTSSSVQKVQLKGEN